MKNPEIIRCNDCRFSVRANGDLYCSIWGEFDGEIVPDDGFCHLAERGPFEKTEYHIIDKDNGNVIEVSETLDEAKAALRSVNPRYFFITKVVTTRITE